MLWTHFILFCGWLLYGLFHSVLASQKIKSILQKGVLSGDKNYLLFYNLFAIITLIPLVLYSYRAKSLPVFSQANILFGLGFFLTVAGLILMSICIAGYFEQLSGLNDVAPSLKTNGMSRYVRHPLYLGTFIFLAGLFFLRPLYSTLVSVLPIMIYTVWALQWEEQKLINKFGSVYREYQKFTPAIFPRLRNMKKKN